MFFKRIKGQHNHVVFILGFVQTVYVVTGKKCLLKKVTIQDIPKERQVFDLEHICFLSPNLKTLRVLKFSALNS